MLDSVKQLVRSGKLKEAAQELDKYVQSSPEASDDLRSDAAVLLQNVSTLVRDEKRRKIKGDALMDAKTRFGYELTDILEQLEGTNSTATQGSASLGTSGSATTPAPPVGGGTTIINYGNIGSVNITNEIRTEINHFYQGVQELKQELEQLGNEPEVVEAIAEIGEVSDAADSLSQITDTESAQGPLSKIKGFFDRLEEGDTTLSKVLKTAKSSAKVLGKLAGTYNSIAQWAAMPQVPTLLVDWLKR